MWIWAPSRADAASCNACHRSNLGLLSQWQSLYGFQRFTGPGHPFQSLCASSLLESYACRLYECSSVEERSGEWAPVMAWLSTLLIGTAQGANQAYERRLQSWGRLRRPCQ